MATEIVSFESDIGRLSENGMQNLIRQLNQKVCSVGVIVEDMRWEKGRYIGRFNRPNGVLSSMTRQELIEQMRNLQIRDDGSPVRMKVVENLAAVPS